MNKIFDTSEEKFLEGVTLYFNSTDSILYYEKENTTFSKKVPAADLINLFKKGLAIVDDGTSLIRPTVLTIHYTSEAMDYAYVSHTTVGASDKAVATSYYSEGYSA